jgi:hypothetical protein
MGEMKVTTNILRVHTHARALDPLNVNADLTQLAQLPIMQIIITYDPTDPYALTFVFPKSTQEDNAWTVARDLVRDGLQYATGIGDVMFEPVRNSRTSYVLMTIHVDGDTGCVIINGEDIRRILTLSYRLVCEGHESKFMNFDAELTSLLEESL